MVEKVVGEEDLCRMEGTEVRGVGSGRGGEVSPVRMEAERNSACDEVREAKDVAVHKGGRPWASS